MCVYAVHIYYVYVNRPTYIFKKNVVYILNIFIYNINYMNINTVYTRNVLYVNIFKYCVCICIYINIHSTHIYIM